MTKSKEQLIEEKEAEINGLQNLLAQGDYKARKLIAELGAIIREQFPEAEMPVYEGYLAAETQAQTFRDRINELQEEIDELKK